MKKILLITSIITSFATASSWADTAKQDKKTDVPNATKPWGGIAPPADTQNDAAAPAKQADDASAPASINNMPLTPDDDNPFGN
ncbi:hypothetical protein [Iodobacter ciconiae]|uniref:Uncharacterized protein n=1 Tax=Iodobacter ciconiae TaxID=2496266 RepID=A0A3S8ZRB3_9NEIS|nr:hypothetical protein [Iodobacter ciconiae]AZN35961.1 hypothetical protein EJO50_05385 [Iodobacter ciconiae]